MSGIPDTLSDLAVPVKDLKHYAENARIGNVDQIAESLRVNGQYRPIVVNRRTNEVLAGNHTLKAAVQLGWSRIAVTWVDVDEKQARRINLVDNKANDQAGYDDQALAVLLKNLEGDFEGTGFVQDELDSLLDKLGLGDGGDDKPLPPVPVKSRTQPGDIWALGRHRLICGSCMDRDTMVALMEDQLANLIVTSPPYNQGIDRFKPSGMQKENPNWVNRMSEAYDDSMPEEEYQRQQAEMLDRMVEWTTEDASFFYNHKNRYREKHTVSPWFWLLKSLEWEVRQEIIWDRGGSITLNARMFMPSDERLYWLTRGENFRFNDTPEVKAFSTIWPIAPKAEAGVSAPFPVELARRPILGCSRRGDIVLDPYAGSGTVMVAAEGTGRTAYMVEINPLYCDVIAERFSQLTGQEGEIVG
jgi:DNA modification methylase